MLYIRTDMNDKIATGHVMRCIAIADAVRAVGEDVTFLIADEYATVLLKQRGYDYVVLHSKWDAMESELKVLQKLIAERKIEKLLVDSYQVTERYLKILSTKVKVAYLDDLDKFAYPVSTIICYASYWRKLYQKRNYQEARLYQGLAYVPLRKEFKECKRKKIRDCIDNLVLFSGGTDRYDILNQLLSEIRRDIYKRIDVICGSYYVNYEGLCEKYKECRNIYIHKAVSNVKEYMENADFAVTAGGNTLYELCAVGTPAISYSLADNQLANVKQFQKDGIIEYVGDVRNDNVAENVSQCLEKYWKNRELREEKSKKMQSLVDGHGADRIAEILLKL